MYPNLYYLFLDLFGISIPFLKMIQTFGFFVAISFVLAAWLFTKELKRKEAEGFLSVTFLKIYKGAKASTFDLVSSGLIGALIGYKVVYIILNFSSFLDDTQGFLLSADGSVIGAIALGVYSAWSKYREKEKLRLPEPKWVEEPMHPYQHVSNMTMIAAVAGILGAKIFHNLENIDEFLHDPVDALLSFSGLTMYGGLICGAVSVIYYAVKNKIAPLHLIDACAPGLMLAYGTGRVGCQMAGDGDWGIDNLAPKPSWLNAFPDWVWSYRYPNNVLGESMSTPIPNCTFDKYCFMLEHPVFPTPLYEAIMCIGLFFLLWALRKRFKAPAVLFSFYLLLNGCERFLIEQIRVNSQYHIMGIAVTQAQLISAALIIIGGYGMYFFSKKHKRMLQNA